MPCWNGTWGSGRYWRVFQMTLHVYEYTGEPSPLNNITLWSPLNFLIRCPLVMIGKQISRPQADNSTQTHKNVSKNLELNVALDRHYIDMIYLQEHWPDGRGGPCKLSYENQFSTSSFWLWETLGESVRIFCGYYYKQELNFYICFRCIFFYIYFIEEINKSLMIELIFFFTMLLFQATKEDSLIIICLVCFGTLVLGVFLICAYAYTYVQVYIYTTVILDLDTVLHFIENFIFSSKSITSKIFLCISN